VTATSFGTKNEPKFADGDAPDLAVNPTQAAAYAAKVGNRRVGTATERLAATGGDLWVGLTWGDTTDGNEYRYALAGWKIIYEDGAWVTPTLTAGWTNEASNPVQYKRRNGRVSFRGRASTTGANVIMFTLDPGFRTDVPGGMPSTYPIDATGYARVNVQASGAVTMLTTGPLTNVSLAAVTFVTV